MGALNSSSKIYRSYANDERTGPRNDALHQSFASGRRAVRHRRHIRICGRAVRFDVGIVVDIRVHGTRRHRVALTNLHGATLVCRIFHNRFGITATEGARPYDGSREESGPNRPPRCAWARRGPAKGTRWLAYSNVTVALLANLQLRHRAILNRRRGRCQGKSYTMRRRGGGAP
jgi:hypothetical protein